MAKKPFPHIVSDHKVWAVKGNRLDNGNVLYYYVWADNAEEAKKYLLRTDLKGIAVKFTMVAPAIDVRYEQTINCYLNHPERYDHGIYE